MFDPRDVLYVTSSQHKREEAQIVLNEALLSNGEKVRLHFDFHFDDTPIKEVLEVDLESMVRAEARQAYLKLHVPCIVEHAGLVFDDYKASKYPGGLTKPMWNALGDDFIRETNSAKRSAVARAVVAYCDGLDVHIFDGETHGTLADAPRGNRAFYWDTAFIPDGETRTYSEISDQDGLQRKVLDFSQSTKALLAFLNYRLAAGLPLSLWG